MEKKEFLDLQGLGHLWKNINTNGIRRMTQAEYDTLSQEEKAGLVVLTDVNASSTIFVTWTEAKAELENELAELTTKNQALKTEIADIENYLTTAEQEIKGAIASVLGGTPSVATIPQLADSVMSAKILPLSYSKYLQYKLPFIKDCVILTQDTQWYDIYAVKTDNEFLTDGEQKEIQTWIFNAFRPHFNMIAEPGGNSGYRVPWVDNSDLPNQNVVLGQVHIYNPNTYNVNISVAVTPASGYTLDQVKPIVTEKISTFFKSFPLGGTLKLTDLQNLFFSIPEITNYRMTSPASDVAGRTTYLPRLNNLTIRELASY